MNVWYQKEWNTHIHFSVLPHLYLHHQIPKYCEWFYPATSLVRIQFWNLSFTLLLFRKHWFYAPSGYATRRASRISHMPFMVRSQASMREKPANCLFHAGQTFFFLIWAFCLWQDWARFITTGILQATFQQCHSPSVCSGTYLPWVVMPKTILDTPKVRKGSPANANVCHS